MKLKYVEYEVKNNVARITANRPRYRNAQSRQLLEDLDAAFVEAKGDDSVHVVALFGAGDHFSGGHDLGTEEELLDRKHRPIEEGIRGLYDHSREQFLDKSMRWREFSKPTIAGVQGYCIFGGWILASAMDIIYAATNAMFLGSNFQFFTVPWDLNVRRAKEILFESRFIDANEAMDLGLVNRVTKVGDLRHEVLAYAERIAQNDPFQLRMIKMAVNHAQDTQGFHAHTTAAHLMHMMSAQGERDPAFALQVPEGKRRPMVEKAFSNYQLRQDRATDGE